MSRGAGFSDGCSWTPPPGAHTADPVDPDVDGIQQGVMESVDDVSSWRPLYDDEPPLDITPTVEPEGVGTLGRGIEADARNRVSTGLWEDEQARKAPEQPPQYWDGSTTGRTPVEEGGVPVGAAGQYGGGDRPMTSADRAAQLQEGQQRTATRAAYTARRIDGRPDRPDNLTPSQREIFDAPMTMRERNAVVDEVVRMEVAQAKATERRIAAMGIDPRSTQATIVRLQDAAQWHITRERNVTDAIMEVRGRRVAASANTEAPPPNTVPAGTTNLAEVTTRTVTPPGKRPKPEQSQTPLARTMRQKAAAAKGQVLGERGKRVYNPDEEITTVDPDTGQVTTRTRKGGPARRPRADQRKVVDGELMPPEPSTPRQTPFEPRTPTQERADNRAAAAMDAAGDRALSPRQKIDAAEDMFLAEHGQLPRRLPKKGWNAVADWIADPSKDSPYSPDDTTRMRAQFKRLAVLEAKRVGTPRTGKYPESQRQFVDQFIEDNGREPSRLELEEFAAIREAPVHRRPQ